jgi:hypothetical protein
MIDDADFGGAGRTATHDEEPLGIVMADHRWSEDDHDVPRISAFIWGGKARPTPVLRFGRWKGAA